MKERFALFKTFIALALIAGTVVASNWQFQRGLARHELNQTVRNHVDLPTISLRFAVENASKAEWRTVKASGRFQPDTNILLRNRYFEGQYGFELLTLFIPDKGPSFWVDRGWVKAGADATIKPTLPPTPESTVGIEGRFRLNSSLPQGTIFATSSASTSPLIREVNAQRQIENQIFYVDLISASDPLLTPSAPAQLPELSDGPHMAYAVQWLFFGGLIGYGRVLMRRKDLDDYRDRHRAHLN